MTDSYRRLPVRLTALLALGVLGLIGAAAADPPPTAASAAPALTDQELHTAYAEVQAIGGMVYTYYITGSDDEAKLDAFIKRVGRMPSQLYVEKLGLKKVTAYAFSAPPGLRDLLRVTPVGQMSHKYKLETRSIVMYVAEAKFVPVPPLEQMKDALPKLVQAGTIPAPADVVHPPLVYMYAASQVHSVEALGRLAPEADINGLLPNGSTMLSNAIAGDQPDLVSALLDRHADPNKCSAGTCPLTSAVYAKDAPAMLGLLLAHGANPGITDPDVGALSPPLTLAIRRPNGIALADLLLAKGANVDGLPSDTPPIVSAAQQGNRAAVEMLLKHGADLYRPSIPPLPPMNALTVARQANTDAAFQSWLNEQWQDRAKRSGRFQWRASIEQDGKETPIGDKPIVVSRKPFSIVVHMRPDVRFMVTASTERSVFDDYKDPKREGGAAMHTYAAVVADVCSGDQRSLFLSGPSKDPRLNGNRVMSWADTTECSAFTASTADADAKRYVRSIGTLSTYDGDQDIGTSTIPSLYFVVGTALDTVFPEFAYMGAKQFEIRFH